jgi:hypothetical protein
MFSRKKRPSIDHLLKPNGEIQLSSMALEGTQLNARILEIYFTRNISKENGEEENINTKIQRDLRQKKRLKIC